MIDTANNKIVFGSRTLVDLTSDTVTADTLRQGCTAHSKDGTIITGTFLEGWPSTITVANTPTNVESSNEEVNKVIYNGETLIDLTSDTVTTNSLLVGYVAHGNDGSIINGTMMGDGQAQYTFLEELKTDNDVVITTDSNEEIDCGITYTRTSQGVDNSTYSK